MASEQLLLWIAAGAAAFVLTWLLRMAVARATRVRAHQRRKQQYLDDRRRQAHRTRVRKDEAAMQPRHAEAIRRAAEQAAQRSGGHSRPPNPFRSGTREFVLWETSFALATAQLEDEEASIWPPSRSPSGA